MICLDQLFVGLWKSNKNPQCLNQSGFDGFFYFGILEFLQLYYLIFAKGPGVARGKNKDKFWMEKLKKFEKIKFVFV